MPPSEPACGAHAPRFWNRLITLRARLPDREAEGPGGARTPRLRGLDCCTGHGGLDPTCQDELHERVGALIEPIDPRKLISPVTRSSTRTSISSSTAAPSRTNIALGQEFADELHGDIKAAGRDAAADPAPLPALPAADQPVSVLPAADRWRRCAALTRAAESIIAVTPAAETVRGSNQRIETVRADGWLPSTKAGQPPSVQLPRCGVWSGLRVDHHEPVLW